MLLSIINLKLFKNYEIIITNNNDTDNRSLLQDHQASAWFITTIIFVVLFVLMIGTSIYLCCLRQRRMQDIHDANVFMNSRDWDNDGINIYGSPAPTPIYI